MTRRKSARRAKYAPLPLAAGLLLAVTAGARADEEAKVVDGIQLPSVATSLPYNGDRYGTRRKLADQGMTFGWILTSEVLSNVSGGLRRGTVFEGKLEGFVKADLEKLLGIRGLSFYANAFQIHGTGGIARNLVGSFNTISNIEALPTTRLSELWFEQEFFGGMASFRIGQLAADTEFFVSDQSQFFMNSDWPAILKHDLPSGGPAYPLSTPGMRLKVEPSKQWTLLLALFNGDPAGPGPGDAEIKNRYGINFRVQDPPFLIGEVQYRYNQGANDTGLAGIIRLGGWYHFGSFDSQRFDTAGLSLANPLSSGIPARLRGDGGVYGIIDQQIYRPAGAGPDTGISVFSRISAAPSDRNLINFYLDGGIVFSGMVPNRPDDKFGATFIYSNISSAARALDRDMIRYTGQPYPVRNFEMNLAFAYMAQIIPGWTVQGEVQYIMNPDGNVPLPGAASPTTTIPNATVLAVRSVIRY